MNNCAFCSGQIKTLIAMTTYSLHRFTTEKSRNRKKNCLNWDFLVQKCLLSSPLRFVRLLSKSPNLIGCHGDKKGRFLKTKYVENLLRNHMVAEADTLHTWL